MAARKKTPAALTLEDLLKSYKEQNITIPDSVKEIMEKKGEKPVEIPKVAEKTPTKKQKVKTATKETKDKTQSEEELYDKAVALVQSEGKMDAKILAFRLAISRSLAQKFIDKMAEEGLIEKRPTKTQETVQNLVGKNTASKLIKKQSTEEPVSSPAVTTPFVPPTRPVVSKVQNNEDLKVIRANLDEIHQFFLGQKKPLGPALPRSKKSSNFFKSFLGGLTNDKFAEKFFPHHQLPKHERTKKQEKNTPSTTQRLPLQSVSGELNKFQLGLNQDQQTAEHTKEFVQQEDDAKSFRERLDRIQSSIDDMKKKLDTLLGRKSSAGGGILGTLANLWNVLKMAWGAIKIIGKTVGTIFKEIGKITKWIAEGTWNTMKNAFKKLVPYLKTIGLREIIAGSGAAAATAGLAYATDRIAKYEYDRAAEPFKKLEQDYGLKALGNGNFELNGKNYHNYMDSEVQGKTPDLPDEYKTLITAKTGDMRGGTSKRAQDYIKQHDSEFEALRVKPTQPQKTLPTALSNATKAKDELESDADNEPVVVVVKGGNKTTVIPASQSNPIGVVVSPRNPEPSADSLNAGIFDTPQGYGSIYRM
jgi:ribosomal protein S25